MTLCPCVPVSLHTLKTLLHAESYKVTKLQIEFSTGNSINILYLYYIYYNIYNINIIYGHVTTLNQMTVKTVV